MEKARTRLNLCTSQTWCLLEAMPRHPLGRIEIKGKGPLDSTASNPIKLRAPTRTPYSRKPVNPSVKAGDFAV